MFQKCITSRFVEWTLRKVSGRVPKDIAVKGSQDDKHRLSIAHTDIMEGFSFLVRQTSEV